MADEQILEKLKSHHAFAKCVREMDPARTPRELAEGRLHDFAAATSMLYPLFTVLDAHGEEADLVRATIRVSELVLCLQANLYALPVLRPPTTTDPPDGEGGAGALAQVLPRGPIRPDAEAEPIPGAQSPGPEAPEPSDARS